MARAKSKKKTTAKAGRKSAKAAGRKPAKRAVAKRVPVAKKRSATGSKPPVRKAAAPNAAMRALAQHIVDLSLGHDDEAILGLYAPTIESSEAGQPPAVGLDALRAKFAGWRSMTSDSVFEPRRVLVDGNVIVIEWLGRVTLAASGRQVELREVAVHEIKNGKIAREAFFYNPAALAG